MEPLSVFDMFKVGVGPSSSHTMGPWLAARRFVDEMPAEVRARLSRISIDLYGSLAKTGRGHGTDIAVQMGLCGEDPETIDVTTITERVDQISLAKRIRLDDDLELPFDPDTDIRFNSEQQLPAHPNALRIAAQLTDDCELESVFYSIGGGFVVKEGEPTRSPVAALPYPIDTAQDLLGYCHANDCRIADIVMQNELAWRGRSEIHDGLARIRNAMLSSIHRGCLAEGVLPGGLRVHRRAAAVSNGLLGAPCPSDRDTWLATLRQQPCQFEQVVDWVSCFALAVNEENAGFGRIVTAPTNGAAGVIPAVLLYALNFCDMPDDSFIDFLLTAGEIGCLFKKGATISAAMGGCQAEIGVSSAMAAAALTESFGGSPGQATEAAEIAMEHHLGMTCDPIGGLVQIPCIERNAMGAIKAITAARMALARNPRDARVSLDAVIRTMWETAQDMNAKYKETSEGGLAVQISVNVSEC
jgi:L-serine dehydratase